MCAVRGVSLTHNAATASSERSRVNVRSSLIVNHRPHIAFETNHHPQWLGTQYAVASAMISETLLNRARDRCSQHRDINGFCPCCLEFVLAEALVEANPGLCMDDAIDVVTEWVM